MAIILHVFLMENPVNNVDPDQMPHYVCGI